MSIEEVSKAELYVQQKVWQYRVSDDQIILETCPIGQCDNWHFYLKRGGEKDGLFSCKKCGAEGNLYKLRELMGDREASIESMKDAAFAVKKPDPLPDVVRCHQTLLADEDAMSYLFDERGFSPEIIKKQMLGLMLQNDKKYLVIPYIESNRVVYAKYRTLPPAEKDFRCPKGREAILYNADVITPGAEEIILIEGELNVVACIANGLGGFVGVPGANNKKMAWVTRLDAAAPKRIYILYDNDINNKENTGQVAAAELAKRISLNTALPVPLNIVLPEFETYDGKRGKDMNDWFRAGHTINEFLDVKAAALPFEVRGVVSAGDALTLLEESLSDRELLEPTYVTQWPSLNQRLGGFEPGDVVDILARGKIGKSTMGFNIIDHLVATYGEPGFVHCLEMPTARMIRKMVSHLTQTDDTARVTPEEKRQHMLAMRAAIPVTREIYAARKADMLFCDRTVRTVDEAYEIMYQAVRRYGIKFAMIDNLQMLSDVTLRRASERHVHLSQISKNYKRIATELSLVMIRIVQPKKVLPGDIPDHEDADGSGAISKDCDGTIVLHRTQRAKVNTDQFESAGYVSEELALDPALYTRVSISRYAPGGTCTLYIDGATSTIREMTPLEHNNIMQPTIGHGVPTLHKDEGRYIEA